MQSRKTSREWAIILFCFLGVSSLNAWAHAGYQFHPRQAWVTILKAIGKDGVKSGYERLTLYELLDKHASDAKAVEAMKGVSVEGEILRETAVDPEDPNASQAEKVGNTFKLSRYFSETGSEEGAHIISIEVNGTQSQNLTAGMWVRVQGHVRTLAGDEGGKPILDAEQIDKVEHSPEQRILTPQGEMQTPEMGEESHEGHNH